MSEQLLKECRNLIPKSIITFLPFHVNFQLKFCNKVFSIAMCNDYRFSFSALKIIISINVHHVHDWRTDIGRTKFDTREKCLRTRI